MNLNAIDLVVGGPALLARRGLCRTGSGRAGSTAQESSERQYKAEQIDEPAQEWDPAEDDNQERAHQQQQERTVISAEPLTDFLPQPDTCEQGAEEPDDGRRGDQKYEHGDSRKYAPERPGKGDQNA